MSSNKLMEAAAEILAGSKKGSTAMPPEKLAGEVVDIGGPTPQNGKPDDNSEKLDTTKAAKSATAPTTKPSDASSDTQNKPVGGKKTMKEDEAKEEEVISEEEATEESSVELVQEEKPQQFHEDITALFADDATISEEFKTKVSAIFEARVQDRIAQIAEETEARYAGMLEEAVESIRADLTEKVDDYMNYVVEQWLEENEIAIQSGLRSEVTEEFIVGLRNLFAEHYIDVPEEKVDLVEELATKVEELEGKLNEEIETNISFKKALIESAKKEIVRDICAGLTETQVEKMGSLAESVTYSTEEEFKTKLEAIRENYFPSQLKKADETQLHEQVSEVAEEKQYKSHDSIVDAVFQSISKTTLK